jgi:hypothetical protein
MAIGDIKLTLSLYETVWLYHAILNMASSDIAMAVPTYPARTAAGIARGIRDRLAAYTEGDKTETEFEVVQDAPEAITTTTGEPEEFLTFEKMASAFDIIGKHEHHLQVRVIKSTFLPKGFAVIGTGDPGDCGIKLGGWKPIDPNHGQDSLCVTGDTLPDKTNGDK